MAKNDPDNEAFPRYKKPQGDKKKGDLFSGSMQERLKKMAKNIKSNNGKDKKHHHHSSRSKSDDKKDDKKDEKKDDKKDDQKDSPIPKFDITNPASMLGNAENSLKKMTGMAEGAMAEGAKKLASVIMPNVNPQGVMSGMMKFAKLLAPKPASMPPKPAGGLPKISGTPPTGGGS